MCRYATQILTDLYSLSGAFLQYNLSTEVIALVFLVMSGMFTVGSPVWGYLSNWQVSPAIVAIYMYIVSIQYFMPKHRYVVPAV